MCTVLSKFSRVLAAGVALVAARAAFAADGGAWQVSKSSGEVWVRLAACSRRR